MSSASIAKKRSSSKTNEVGVYFGARNKVLTTKKRKGKNNEIVGAMYAMYKTHRSLAYIGKVYHRTPQCIFYLFKRRGYQLRPKKMEGLQEIDGIKFTLNKAGSMRGTLNGKRILMHHYVWEKKHGKIPTDHCIFHKDGNNQNNRIGNLGLLPRCQVAHHFNPENHNQYTNKKRHGKM